MFSNVFQVSYGTATSDINMPQIHPNTSNGFAFTVLPRGNFGNSRHLQQQRVGSWRDKDFTFHSKCIKWRCHGLFFPSLPSQQTPPLWLSRSTKGLAPCNFSQDITKHQKTESILQNHPKSQPRIFRSFRHVSHALPTCFRCTKSSLAPPCIENVSATPRLILEPPAAAAAM